MQFKAYSAERLTIESIASRLTPDENSLRKWLMEYIIDRGIPFNLKSGEMENTGPPEGLTLAKRLAEKRVIVVDAKGNINFVYPVSAIPSHHKVHFDDGRVFSAMCAIDALGAAFTFKRNVVVASRCSECGKPVSVAIKDGQIAQLLPKTAHALHVDLKKIDNWAGSCWNIMNFFCTKEHYDIWVGKMGINEDEVFCLDVHEAVEVARMLFAVV